MLTEICPVIKENHHFVADTHPILVNNFSQNHAFDKTYIVHKEQRPIMKHKWHFRTLVRKSLYLLIDMTDLKVL